MSGRIKKTKIVTTIGPASNSMEMLLQLAAAGANVFRLNFSHGTHEEHKKVIDRIREINKKFNYNIAILQDLQGPKIRIGNVENNGVELVNGNRLVISVDDDILGTAERVSTSYSNFTQDVKVGDSVLVDDGRIRLLVKETSEKEVVTEVVVGGVLKSHKGMNLPDTNISEGSLTKKDLKDLEFGIQQDVDWVAISFVRHASDMDYLRDLIDQHGKQICIMAKIERPEALINIDKIIDATDAIMIARGDLGVETSFSEVPIVQKRIIDKCRESAKPVVVATQMLESMISNPTPTRAEVNDVATAVMEGVDAVMLSAESAAGEFPIEAVSAMSEIISSVEKSEQFNYDLDHYKIEMEDAYSFSRHIIQNGVDVSRDIHAKGIILFSKTGFCVRHLARHRPNSRMFIFVQNEKLRTILSLVWGVETYLVPKIDSSTEGFLTYAEKFLQKGGHLDINDTYVNLGAIPPSMLGVRMVNIGRIGERGRITE